MSVYILYFTMYNDHFLPKILREKEECILYVGIIMGMYNAHKTWVCIIHSKIWYVYTHIYRNNIHQNINSGYLWMEKLQVVLIFYNCTLSK